VQNLRKGGGLGFVQAGGTQLTVETRGAELCSKSPTGTLFSPSLLGWGGCPQGLRSAPKGPQRSHPTPIPVAWELVPSNSHRKSLFPVSNSFPGPWSEPCPLWSPSEPPSSSHSPPPSQTLKLEPRLPPIPHLIFTMALVHTQASMLLEHCRLHPACDPGCALCLAPFLPGFSWTM
jgi:hypothetical protein